MRTQPHGRGANPRSTAGPARGGGPRGARTRQRAGGAGGAAPAVRAAEARHQLRGQDPLHPLDRGAWNTTSGKLSLPVQLVSRVNVTT